MIKKTYYIPQFCNNHDALWRRTSLDNFVTLDTANAVNKDHAKAYMAGFKYRVIVQFIEEHTVNGTEFFGEKGEKFNG